jgi:hypothetical protein
MPAPTITTIATSLFIFVSSNRYLEQDDGDVPSRVEIRSAGVAG